MAEATLYRDANANSIVVEAPEALDAGEVIQLPDGRAGVAAALAGVADGDNAALMTAGVFTLAKTSGVVILDGDRLYWDRSANTATPLQAAAGADFPIGVAVGDAASADTTVRCDLNKRPVYVVDVMAQITDTAIVKTSGAPSVASIGGQILLAIDTTGEAQKVDVLSQHSVPVTIPFIVEGIFAIKTESDNAAADWNIGIANATHATDADSITESVFLHFDGNATAATMRKINAESDDGTTEVSATDTTVVAGSNTPVHFRFDCRDLTDIKIYIDGVRVLSSSTFKLDAATGPMKLLAHLEKSGTDDTPGELSVSHLAIRAMDVDE